VCSQRHCPRSSKKLFRAFSCQRDCGMININLLENECRNKKVVVLKIIRYEQIEQLKFLTEELNLDVKIIHLIRDPRAIAYSRSCLKVWMKTKNVLESINLTCQKQLNNIRFSQKQPDWLKGKYKFVRYEDTALNPYETAEEVYKFVGLNMTSQVLQWIRQNTGVKAEKSLKRNEIQEEQLDKRIISYIRNQLRNPYSRARLSSTIVQKWTLKFPFVKVAEIQRACHRMMNESGYKQVVSSREYSNKSISYVYPL